MVDGLGTVAGTCEPDECMSSALDTSATCAPNPMNPVFDTAERQVIVDNVRHPLNV
jgi:hypothetical protein